MEYEFEVIGKIVGKERPRVNMYSGMVYTPTKTKDYETLVQQYFKIKYPKYYCNVKITYNDILLDIITIFMEIYGIYKISNRFGVIFLFGIFLF